MTLQVFISYKSQERSFAEQLRDQLRAWGFSTWLDKDNIPEGAYFRHEIQKGLETSQVVIGLLTEEALQSREVMWEWDYALYNSRLIPVMLRPCKLPYHLQGTQYLDFTQPNTTAFDRLHKAITSPVGAQYIAPSPASITKPQITTSTSATNRTRMLDKVHEFWVVGVLENALKESGTFELGLSAVPGAVLKHIDYGDYQLPSTAGIGEVFNDLNRELLILGAPGAGKTILLLQLARHLIERARADESQPIPVVVNLSSWAIGQKPLQDWLVDELRQKYQIPKEIAQEWVEHEKLLLLLDGLDEVAEEFRNQCVDAINAFRIAYKIVDLVVSSRIADYEILISKLDLRGAIVLQSLTSNQINTYLNRQELNGLRSALETDDVLKEMAETPFLLNTMAYTYQGTSAINLQFPRDDDPLAIRLSHLFDNFVEKRLKQFQHRSNYPPKQVWHYLIWLAEQMTDNEQTVFYIEDMQPTWVRYWKEFNLYRLTYRTIFAFGNMLIAGMVFALIFAFAFGVLFKVKDGITVGIIGLLLFVIIGGFLVIVAGLFIYLLGRIIGKSKYSSKSLKIINLLFKERQIWTVDNLRWRWSLARLYDGLTGITFRILIERGVIYFPIFWAVGIIIINQLIKSDLWLHIWVGGGLVVMFSVWLAIGIVIGLNYSTIEKTHYPNQNINRSLYSGLKFGFLVGTVIGTIVGISAALAFGIIWGAVVGITSFMIGTITQMITFDGTVSAIRHLALRILLYHAEHIPWNYARFLDYCASIGLLRKVGGGYIFAHRYLLEYFAELDA